jgi:predicted transcriptional regulator
MAEKQSIDGQWVRLASTTNGNVPLSNSDLDDIVRNFNPTTVADHIPVRFGKAKGNGPVVGRLSDLRRDGPSLSGKLAGVDPRFDQLFQSGKLGGRTSRSLSFARMPGKGATLTGYGFMPPGVYVAGAMNDGPSTDAALSSLAAADTAGESVQFNANDAGRLEVTMEQHTMKQPTKHSGAETLRFQTNSERLTELAKARQRNDKISFGEALSKVAEENPELTLPDGVISFREPSGPKSNGQRLSELAYSRQREDKISFSEALEQVARENPELTRN